MAKYLFIYHGGKTADNAQDAAKAMDKWGKWFGSLGAAVIDGGNPVGKSYTVLITSMYRIVKSATVAMALAASSFVARLDNNA